LIQSHPALQLFVDKLETHTALDDDDRAAILALPHTLRTLEASAYLFREGDHAANCCVILSGFACRHKIVAGGARQILSVHMRGDGTDLQNAFLPLGDHSIQALTRVEVAFIPADKVREAALARPLVGRALWSETLLDAAIQREWTANVGRRDSRTRIAHLLCELGLRQERIGLCDRRYYALPMTQEQLADATGLTPVHVNRTLQALRAEGVIAREKRTIDIADWDHLTRIGDFHMAYLEPPAHKPA
jgi:CRP-like cAMP-binding protein